MTIMTSCSFRLSVYEYFLSVCVTYQIGRSAGFVQPNATDMLYTILARYALYSDRSLQHVAACVSRSLSPEIAQMRWRWYQDKCADLVVAFTPSTMTLLDCALASRKTWARHLSEEFIQQTVMSVEKICNVKTRVSQESMSCSSWLACFPRFLCNAPKFRSRGRSSLLDPLISSVLISYPSVAFTSHPGTFTIVSCCTHALMSLPSLSIRFVPFHLHAHVARKNASRNRNRVARTPVSNNTD